MKHLSDEQLERIADAPTLGQALKLARLRIRDYPVLAWTMLRWWWGAV